MKNRVKYVVVLFTITALSGLILGITHEATKDVIAAREKMESLQLNAILPNKNADDVKKMNVEIAKDDVVNDAYEAYEKGELVGHAIIVSPKGMGGPIKMTVGIYKDGKIGGLKVVTHSETPGIGDIVEKEEFMGRFKDKPIKEKLELVKTSPSKENQVQAITGATITSGAVNSGVNEAIKFYKGKVLGETVEDENKEITPKDIIPEGETMKPIDAQLNEKITDVKGIYKGEELLGYAITASAKGMNDEVKTMVGISVKGSITNIKVVKQKETESLGDDILKEEFTDKFKNKPTDKPLKSVKEKPKDNREIEALSGSTISTDAVINGVNEAVKFYNEKLKK